MTAERTTGPSFRVAFRRGRYDYEYERTFFFFYPLQSLGQMNPKLNVMKEGALNNMHQWSKLVDQNYKNANGEQK